jgi:hypothetical protein
LLSECPEFRGIELLEAVAEKKTQFDADPHGPRNHDLLIRARVPAGRTVTVGVEGKADEAFDDPLWRYREKGLQRSAKTGALDRIDWMVRRWFGTSLRADRTSPPLICLGYQLFSALAGTLADAKIDSSRQAVVLVMEYFTDCTDDDEHAHNAQVLDSFLTRLIGPEPERAVTPNGWITAPISIAGDGVWTPRTTEVAFGKLMRWRRTSPAGGGDTPPAAERR